MEAYKHIFSIVGFFKCIHVFQNEMIGKIDTPSYIIDKKILKRFNQRQTVFGRKLYDAKSGFYKISITSQYIRLEVINLLPQSRILFIFFI